MKIKNHVRKQPRIEMLPLIDIVFLLLIFFIYAMLSMSVHHGLDLNLPSSGQVEKTEESPLSLSITTRDTSILLAINDTPVTLEDLAQQLRIKNDLKQGDEHILIFAGKEISYQQLFLVLDEVKRSGLHKISLQATLE